MSEETKTFSIVQIGYGVLGKAYTNAFQSTGNKVSVIEANRDFVDENKATLDIYHVSDSLEHLRGIDFITIMVNTPLVEGRLEMKYLQSTVPNVASILKNNPDALVLIRSTVRPMFTKWYSRALREILPEQEIHVAFQPEFLRAASSYEDAKKPWLVVLGSNDLPMHLKDRFYRLYAQYVDTSKILELGTEEAELQKLAHNCFNAAKISFFNEFQLLCEAISERHQVSIDMNKISKIVVKTCEGILNPRYGTTSGHAYYGACLPKDSAELAGLESEYNLPVKMFQSVVDVNGVFVSTDEKEVLDGDNHMPNVLLAERAWA
ncbi:hypothetical protein HDV03_005505 [Kappamyces sp. JEL0829]|nr:hypothetical protein HDV03_005505 [Kappamyces sp. JEL0829]